MTTLNVKVVPGSRQNRIVGAYGDGIKLQVTAPPEGGRANDAVIDLLSKTLGVKRGQITLTAGHSSPRKTIRIDGLEVDVVFQRLGV
jgi:uncharacterized protein (TIGR00251 family)